MSSSHNYLTDENLSPKLARHLTAAGYNAVAVLRLGFAGRPDRDVFAYARVNQMVIITGDGDFLNARLFPAPHAGIIVLQFLGKTKLSNALATLLPKMSEIDQLTLSSHTYIVDTTGVHLHH
jgi:predicted nuclease of predicted toxin-antitoxin system